MGEILFLSLLLVLILSSIWDIRKKIIPNAFIIVGLLLGLLYSSIEQGWAGLLSSLSSTVIMLFLGFFLLYGIMAGGDVKLLIVISSFVGVVATLKVTLLTIMLSSFLFIIINPKRFKNSLTMITNFLFYTVPLRMYEMKESIAYAPYITVSYIVFCFVFL